MTPFQTDQPVGDIVARFPGASRLFERHAIDYCCGGRTSLDDACAERGLEPGAILAEIEAARATAPAVDRRDWTTAPISELIDHILVAYHAPLREDLAHLTRLSSRALTAHGDDRLPMTRLCRVLGDLRAELESHLLKEEIVLFPAAGRLAAAAAAPSSGVRVAEPCGSIAVPIQAMEHEHADASAQLAALREMTGGYAVPSWACPTLTELIQGLQKLEEDLHRHIHLENEVLFPRTLELTSRNAG